MFPMQISFFWLGREIEPWAIEHVDAFRKMNPSHDVLLHRDASALYPPWAELYDMKAANVVMQNDLLKLSIIRQYGGWAMDIDCVPLRPLPQADVAALIGNRLVTGNHERKPSSCMLAAASDCGIWPVLDRELAKCLTIARDELPFTAFGSAPLRRMYHSTPDWLWTLETARPEDKPRDCFVLHEARRSAIDLPPIRDRSSL